MKSYTDIEQSKKLAELSLEGADMAWYPSYAKEGYSIRILNDTYPLDIIGEKHDDIPAWSLSALLSVIPYNVTFNKAVYRFKLVKFTDHWECYHENFGVVSVGIFKADNPVDACVEMILKLHDLNLL